MPSAMSCVREAAGRGRTSITWTGFPEAIIIDRAAKYSGD